MATGPTLDSLLWYVALSRSQCPFPLLNADLLQGDTADIRMPLSHILDNFRQTFGGLSAEGANFVPNMEICSVSADVTWLDRRHRSLGCYCSYERCHQRLRSAISGRQEVHHRHL
jgi:hypothetical protein